MLFVLPSAAFAEDGDMNQKVDISELLNYDLVIQKKSSGFYNGTPLKFMYNKANMSQNVTLDGIAYSLTVNDYGVNDSVYVSDSDISLSDISGLAETESGYTPKPKSLGIIAGAMEENADISVKIVYKNNSSETKNLTVSPINVAGEKSSSVGASCVKKSTSGNRFTVQDGDAVYLNAYSFELKPSAVKDIVFMSGDKAYHISAVSILYYTEEEWTANIGKIVNSVYPTYRDKTPESEIISYSDMEELITALSAIKDDFQAGKDVGLSGDIKNEISDKGIESELLRFSNLYSYLSIRDEKKKLKAEADALNADSYLNAAEDAYKAYTSEDLKNIESLISIYEKAQALDSELEDVVKYWEALGISVETAEFNSEDSAKLSALKEKYVAYQKELSFKNGLNSLFDSLSSKKLEDITESDFADLKAFFENDEYFDSEFNSDFATADNESKIKALKYFYDNFEIYKQSEAPYMVKMQYNRNIFGAAGEKATSDFGFYDRITPISSDGKQDSDNVFFTDAGIDREAVAKLLTNGVLYSSSVGSFSQNYSSVNAITKVVSSSDLKNYGVTATPFDLKNYNNGQNAYMPQSASDVLKLTQECFSGKSAKYLLVLLAIGNSYCANKFNVTYTDGNVKEYSIADGWARTHEGIGALQQTEKLYGENGVLVNTTGGTGGNSYPNAIYLVAHAIELDEKPIKSVEFSSSRSVNVQPLVAVTEIPVSNTDFVLKTAASAWDVVKDFTEADFTAANLDKIKAVVNAYNEVVARGLNADEIFAYENKESGVDKIKEMSELVLTAANETKRTKINEISSKISFSVPATDIEKYISVTKNGKNTDYNIKPSDDGKSVLITITVDKNGGDVYKFKASGELPVKKNKTMTMGSDYEYNFTVPDYVTYDYDKKTVSVNADEPATLTAASVCVGADGKTVYAASSEKAENVGRDVKPVGVSLSEKEGSNVISYAFDDNFKLISNDSSVKKVTAEAIKDADYKIPNFDIKTNTLTIRGYTPKKGEDKLVNLKIYDSKNSRDIYYGSVKTNKDGYFEFEIILPESVYGSAFTMNFTLGGDDFSTPEKLDNEIYYATSAERNYLIEYMKNAKDISELTNGSLNGEKVTVSKIVNTFALKFEPVSVISDDAFAKSIINILSGYKLTSLSDFELTQKVLKQAAVLAALYEGKTDCIYKNGELLFEDIMNYEKIDESGVTLYNVFKKNVSLSGKEKIVKAVAGKEYNSVSELYSALSKTVFAESLNSPSSLGTGYISAVLTSENAKAVNADISKYISSSKKSAYNEKISENRGNFTDVASVEAFIKGIKISESSQSSSSSPSKNSNSKPTSSVTVSGIDPQDDSQSVNTLIFNDLPESHWAYNNIISLYNKGIISGKGDKLFDPDGYLTRGEAAKMICEAYGLSGDGENPFYDTADKWYADYAMICYKNKLINGMTETYFGGDEKITRQDLCVILYRLKNAEANSELTFADSEEIADYAKEAVAYMTENKIINGFSDNTFRPNEFCTRSQMAKILDLFMGL